MITIKAGEYKELLFPIDTNDFSTIAGATLTWWLSTQMFGKPFEGIVKKDNGLLGGVEIVGDPTQKKFKAILMEADTINLEGYYYQEARVIIGGKTSFVSGCQCEVVKTIIR